MDLIGSLFRFVLADYDTFFSYTRSPPLICCFHAFSSYTDDKGDHNFANLADKITQNTYKSVDLDANLSASSYIG